MIFLAEKTGTQFPIGGQPNARTVPAKWLGDWRDQTDFAGRAVGETVFARGLAGFVLNLHQRPARVNARMNFRCRNHQVARPVAISIGQRSANKWPLGGIDKSGKPVGDIRAINSSTPGRTSGSPPVTRTLRIPKP